jgi:5-methylcytosine-specific restriction endonuclease McrA
MTAATFKLIFSRTNGHCHFCGDKLIFGKRGLKRRKNEDGAWEVDHVIQKDKGGRSAVDNYLPACVRCNRLRWHRKGEQLRELLLLGLIATGEIKKGTETGTRIMELKEKRVLNNKKRRSLKG